MSQISHSKEPSEEQPASLPVNETWAAYHRQQQHAYDPSRQHGSVHHRFWVGWKSPGRERSEFDRAIREIFAPATVVQGQGRGLIAYQPVLVDNANSTLPDEVALVSYLDEAIYKTIAKSPPGRVYQPLHADYFNLDSQSEQSSHSTAPEPFSGHVQIGKAYDLRPYFRNWQMGKSVVAISERNPSFGDSAYEHELGTLLSRREEILKDGKIDAYTILIKPEFTIEYIHFPQHSSHTQVKLHPSTQTRTPLPLVNRRVIQLTPHTVKSTQQPNGSRELQANFTFPSDLQRVELSREADELLRHGANLEAIRKKFLDRDFSSLILR